MTQDELKELSQLETEFSAISKPVSGGGMTENEMKELAQLEGEFQQFNKPLETNKDREADLGTFNRLQYSLEPLESNRKAFLTQQFGAENVREDESGETYVKQMGEWRPVNKDGISLADGADLLGATPEMLGAGAGVLTGAFTGGASSIPAGMAGAAAGSAARQALSSMLGTPQVAKPIERVAEVGLSTAMGGVGAGVGKLLKKGGTVAVKQIKKAFPKLKISPDGAKLMRIAAEEGLPKPTPGQMAGGDDLVMEKALGARRFFGKKIRKQTQDQIEAIKKNVASDFGDFVDNTPEVGRVGTAIKDRANSYIDGVKSKSSQLFKEVAEESSDVGISAKDFKANLLGEFQKLGVFDSSGNALEHSSRTGMTKDAFDKTQSVFKTILKDLDNSGTDLVDGLTKAGQKGEFLDAKTINTMRQYIDKNIAESGYSFDDVLLMKLKNHFMDVNESMLTAKSPELRDKFKLARSLWSEQLKLKKQFQKGGQKGLGIADVNDAAVLDKVFSGKNQVKMLRDMTDKKTVEKAGISYVNQILSTKLGGVDQVGAKGAISALKKPTTRDAIIESVGLKKYDKLMKNLHYLDRVGEPINPSRTAITQMMTELSPANLATGAIDSAAYKARGASKNAIKSMRKFNEKIPGRARKAVIGLTDQAQKDASYLTRGPTRLPQSEKENKK